ncbi:uncharacterized protein LOC143852544 [Tasmannia lanceolata]|uniref:uncharacterized protein LOC143852544 n=1 Tax=Tasmannia lanceolata TaxID=3420 RepID=UPI00406447BF
MEDQMNSAIHIPKEVSPLTNVPKPSVNHPCFSYAEALMNKSNGYQKTTEENVVHNSPNVSVYRGEPAIYFKESIISSNAEKFKYCLVGKFPCSWPGLTHIREWVARCWKLRGSCSVTLLDHHHVFIRLDNEFDMIRIWVRNRWWVKGHLMKVFKWTPQFRPAREEPSSAAVWIALPFLPVVLFQEDVLFSIASLFGRALAIDKPTRILSRTNVARVCVEVNLLMELPCRVWIGIEGEGFWQDIHYESVPSYCLNCCKQGHSTRICKLNTSEVVACASQRNEIKSSPENSSSAIKEDAHPQEQCRVSKTFVENYVEGETSQAKHVHSCPAIQDKDESNQLVIEASSHQRPRRVTIVEAMAKRLENSKKIRPRKNNGDMEFGGILTRSLIMNETSSLIMNATFLQGMEEEELSTVVKEEEQVLEIETENLILDEERPQASNIILGEDVVEENEFRSYHQDRQNQQHQQPEQDFTQMMEMNVENRNQGQKAPTRRKFFANMPIFFWRKKTKNAHGVDAFLENYQCLGPKRYKYSEIKTMTSSFRNKIGEGGFGSVFKGILPDRSLVAVKVLRDSRKGENEFITEVASLGRTSHVNIIRLLGFCSEGSRRALIYEFMHKGFLDKFIYTRELRNIFGWSKLFQVAVAIARGLEYIHRGCSISIFHLDIKPSNILLDKEFCPRISDFGLAKICQTSYSVSLSCVRGTMGYLAPELMWGKVSDKSDVFSFGIMLLEMASGRKNMSLGSVNSDAYYLPDWIYMRLSQEEDMGLGVFEWVEEEETAKKMILVGLWCTQRDPMVRPSVSRVLEMLEGGLKDLKMPPNPSLHNYLISTSPISEAGHVDSFSNSLQGR